MALAADAAGYAAEGHVDGGGEEGGRDEDEDGLDAVEAQVVGLLVRGGAGYVADDLDC